MAGAAVSPGASTVVLLIWKMPMVGGFVEGEDNEPPRVDNPNVVFLLATELLNAEELDDASVANKAVTATWRRRGFGEAAEARRGITDKSKDIHFVAKQMAGVAEM